jgi:hypothetical protein
VGGGLLLAVGIRALVFVYEHVQEQPITADAARSELSAVEARFAGETPLIDVGAEHQFVVQRTTSAGSRDATTLRAIIYDAATGRIVRDDLPVAVLRVFKGSGFTYLGELTLMRGDTDFERDRVDLTLDDIRHHVGLVLNHRHDSGSHIVIWSE